MKPRGNILMCNECGFKIRTSARKRTCLKCGGIVTINQGGKK